MHRYIISFQKISTCSCHHCKVTKSLHREQFAFQYLFYLQNVNTCKSVSQSCTVAKSKKIMMGHWTINLVFVLTQLHFGQQGSLPFCLQSLIVQWPVRMFHFQLLCMIVKLAYGQSENLKPHHEIETVAVRTCANFQITSTTESEDREV